MHKVSNPYQIKTYKGWLVRWFDNGKAIVRTFPTKQFAKLFREQKIKELNPKLFGLKEICSNKTFDDARNEFLERYDLKELSADSKIQAARTLKYFEYIDEIKKRVIYLDDINQRAIDSFILARKSKISLQTLNKELRYLKSFIRWITKKRYFDRDLEIDFVKTRFVPKKALTDNEIKALLKACPNQCWRMLVSLSLCTGLRKNDIDGLLIKQIDLKRATIDYTARKTNKYNSVPLPNALIPALSNYVHKLDKNSVRLFHDNNIRKTWEAIRTKAKLPNITRHSLRLTFSTYMQKIGSIGTAQSLLQHSSKKVTEMYYTDAEIVLRWKINQLPVKKWSG